MVLGIFSVYDVKSNQYFSPFYAKNFELAKRSLTLSFNSESMLVHYPSDYSLWLLGEFDDEDGVITTVVIDDDGNSVPARERLVEIRELIPESLQQFALDGSFKKN